MSLRAASYLWSVAAVVAFLSLFRFDGDRPWVAFWAALTISHVYYAAALLDERRERRIAMTSPVEEGAS